MNLLLPLSLLSLALVAHARPQFDLGSILSNVVGSSFNTAFGRDCKGRPQGDYFFGCQVPTGRCLGESSFLTFSIPYGQCLGPFNIGRRKRSPQDTRFFINSNQGVGGDFARCSLGSLLNRNTG